MKTTILSSIFCLVLLSSQAQSLITPFAGSSSNDYQSISYSGGETVITTIDSDDVFITQGFQQQTMLNKSVDIRIPSLIVNNGESIVEQSLMFGTNDFPVSTIDHFLVYDALGKIIYQKKDVELIAFQQWWRNTFNTLSLSSGIYFYYIEFEEQGKQKIQTGRIAKM